LSGHSLVQMLKRRGIAPSQLIILH